MKAYKRIIIMIAAIAVALALSHSQAISKNKGGESQGQAKKEMKQEASHGSGHTSAASTSATPPGWDKGKKTGWGGGKYPPGWSKWDEGKQKKWVADRDSAVTEIEALNRKYRIPMTTGNEITNAFNEAVAGGLVIDDARKRLVSALKDDTQRKALMIDTSKSVLDLLK